MISSKPVSEARAKRQSAGETINLVSAVHNHAPAITYTNSADIRYSVFHEQVHLSYSWVMICVLVPAGFLRQRRLRTRGPSGPAWSFWYPGVH